jgi:hypothetical protein
MKANPNLIPNAATQATLDCLRQAVSKALERKRRLGQYSIQWIGNAPFAVGDDAPEHLQTSQQSDNLLNPASH